MLTFSYSPEEIDSLCTNKETAFQRAIDVIAKIPPTKSSFDAVIYALECASAEFSNATNVALFLKYVSTEGPVREMADKWETRIQKLFVDIYAREDLYQCFKSLDVSKLNPVQTRLLDEHLSAFKRNGLELPVDQRGKFLEMKKRLVQLESEFSKRLVEWEDSLALDAKDLEGLPPEYVSGLKKNEKGQYLITLDYPHYNAFMENAKSGEARRQLEFKFNSRGGDENRTRMEEAIALRHELARTLGYASHASLVLERRMAQTPEVVQKFVDRLKKGLKARGERDRKTLLELKKEELGAKTDNELHPWERRYYENLLQKKRYQVDHQKLKEYFPLDTVIKGMFNIYQTLLGVKFTREDRKTWHPSVQAFKVEDGKGNERAVFYVDLYPREGKYGHAAAFTLQCGYEQPDGKYALPHSAIVANFTAPLTGKPSLLEHGEVETLFHEFGHIMHQVLTRARYPSFSGTSVKTDYVEAPSQMFENWVWHSEGLAKLSGHYESHEPLPKAMSDRLIAGKNASQGLFYLRQLAFAQIDLIYHQSGKVDSTEVYSKIMRETMEIAIQKGTQPQASFGHLMGGYDSGYYSYLWSEVFAQDMFTRFKREGLFNPHTGADYRKWILEPGGEQPPEALLKGFLGREPNEEAFITELLSESIPS